MKTKNAQAVAVATSVAAKRWPHLLNELTGTVINPHLPRTWTDNEDRLRGAEVPEGVGFSTKPELARQMIAAVVEHTARAWVAADEVYGRNPDLRAFLEEYRVGYMMAISAADRRCAPRGPVPLK